MTTSSVATNAASSGVKIEKKQLKALAKRSNKPGLIYIAQWFVALLVTGSLVWATLGTIWVWPAMLLYGAFYAVPSYSMSHETAHGTAFKSRWLNETVLWISSLIYVEEPLHRRYTHTNHHTHTWHVGVDSQMPFDTPMDFKGWVADISGYSLARFHVQVMFQLATKRYTDMMRSVVPEHEFPKLTLNARLFLAIYLVIVALIASGIMWPLWFIVLPRVIASPIMRLFTLIQHVEMQENSPSILESTRSFRTTWLGEFLYMRMNHHIEHHLYPQVPFYSLPELTEVLGDQVPEPDPGFWKTNWEVLSVVFRRSLGKSTKAATIRQAPHMITEGGFERISKRTM